FGRGLASIIGDTQLEAELALHASLLQLHVDFADNRMVNIGTLEKYRPLIKPGSLAERIFRRMELVSWLGNPERNQDLWEQSQRPDSELEGKFARMVLSYNMLVASSLQENDYARRIKDDISALLKVNNERISLKYYGCESQYTEFKSSLVFCANDGIKRSPEEELRRQHHEIMHIIAGFMNTTGGKLYIGVNDQHFERGLDEDFKVLRLPYSPDLLKRMDELLNYLTLRVNACFGPATATLVNIAVDEESTKGVLIVTVRPSRKPVKLDDIIYVRLSTSTLPILGRDEIRKFIEQRELAYEDMMKMSEIDSAAASNAITDTPPADDGPMRQRIESISVPIDVPAATSVAPVATSRWRPNVLHESDGNFVVPELYLYFIGEHHYTVSKHDYYTDMDPACRLALVICQADLDSYLVMAYRGEQLIRVPICQLFEKAENTNHRHWSDQPLEWACIAGENDAVLSIHADASGFLHFRATPVNTITRGSMTNVPARILNASVDHTPVWELIAADSVGHFSKALPSNLHSRQSGYSLRTRIDQSDCDKRIQYLLNSCNN
ncbi:MAG: ATP-binding protein, partial [Muribaculaceae bacterium]|nr:ATP-binding protein [Muribaculaceae bacterium]